MVGNGRATKRIVATIAGATLMASLMLTPGLAQAAEDLGAAQNNGALEVVDGIQELTDGGSGDTTENVNGNEAPSAASEDPVIAQAKTPPAQSETHRTRSIAKPVR